MIELESHLVAEIAAAKRDTCLSLICVACEDQLRSYRHRREELWKSIGRTAFSSLHLVESLRVVEN